jgi:hypothetical protein
MIRVFILCAMIAGGLLFEGCREDAVGPSSASKDRSSMIDTLSKSGYGPAGDTVFTIQGRERKDLLHHAKPKTSGRKSDVVRIKKAGS